MHYTNVTALFLSLKLPSGAGKSENQILNPVQMQNPTPIPAKTGKPTDGGGASARPLHDRLKHERTMNEACFTLASFMNEPRKIEQVTDR